MGLEPATQIAVDRFLQQQHVHPCCLIVHPDCHSLQRVGHMLMDRYHWPQLAVGLELSAALRGVEARRRAFETGSILQVLAQRHRAGPVLWTHIDVLFEPSLSLDPVKLLQDTSRLSPLVVLWPGTFGPRGLARITEHLRPFTVLYPSMAERLGEFARLFPIHPAYIDTFEQVYIAEKREVLKTFSGAIRTVLDNEVPTNQTGIISYDHYWDLLRENPSLRTLPGVSEVIDKSTVLEGRIRSAYMRKQLLPMAIRIVHALSVHRLTTDDIGKPLG